MGDAFAAQERLYAQIGTVVDDRRWSETRVHGKSSGGGGYVGPQGGHVAAPEMSVSSTVTNQMQLFLVGEDGKEFDLQFHDIPVGIRAGHRVGVIYAENLQTGRVKSVALVNMTTGKSTIFDTGMKGLAAGQGGLGFGWVGLILFPAIAGWLTSAMTFDVEREVGYNNFEVAAYPWWPIAALVTALLWGFYLYRTRGGRGPKLPYVKRDEVKAAINGEIADLIAKDQAAS